jgi:glycosyltransferase involved in cell wall biosynthesis
MDRSFVLPALEDRGLPGEVTVVHAPGDAHHVEIGLRPLLDGLYDGRPGGWRRATYDDPHPGLWTDEFVILCRPRFPSAPGIVAHRRAAGLPTVVMIDDNWIAAGKEYPRYAGLFLPGRPDYESFLACLRDADATLTFNHVLAEDVRPFARAVEVLPVPVDLRPYDRDPSLAPELGLSVGFTGSPRFESSAFIAMARLAEERPELLILVMAHEVPPELVSVPPGRLHFEPFRASVTEYAARLAALRPTVLVAPLDATRFSASKCPRKFLDAAAARLPGVYSGVPPYSGLVRHGIDGLLTDNSVEAWRCQIDRLLVDPGLRDRIVRSARCVVETEFSLARTLPAFARLLSRTNSANGARG